ncbi:MAG: cytochrome c peroxidase [Planctomycetaceae bacterium]
MSSLWAREVTLASITGDGEAENVRQIEMPFAPRELLFLNDQTLIVADAFGGMLAVVDTRSGAIVKQKTINAHNIRGLCLSHDGRVLHVCHQTLNGEAFTTFEQVFWGVLMQNGLQSIPMTSLVPSNLTVRAERNDDGNAAKEDAERMEQEARSLERVSIGGSQSGTPTTYPLGSPSMGAGDPGKMVVTKSDTTMILLSGVNAMAFRMASHLPFSRLKVGTCPTDVCTDSAEELALVVNRFADTVSVISLQGPEPKVVQTLTLGVMRPITAAERGQQLFYDASLSLDGWYSCHSCHTDGHTNGLLSDTVGDEGQGAPKLVLSLLGAGDTGPWAWLGTKSTLESQIESSLIVSMQSQLDTDDLPVHDLAEFVRTLEPAPSVFAARHSDVVRTEKDPHRQGNIKRSRQLFETLGCADCHADDRLTSGHTFDVGIQDETGHSEFNPPSLRGISQRNRFFHDGRATSLADVLRSGHPGKWRDPSESKGSPGAAADQLSGSLTAEQISLVLDLLNRL